MDCDFLEVCKVIDFYVFTIPTLLKLQLHLLARPKFIQANNQSWRNFYSTLKYIKLISPLRLNLFLGYKSFSLNLEFLNKLSRIGQLKQRFAYQNEGQKVCCLLTHLQICLLQKQHAYLCQFRIWSPVGKIEGKNVLHRTFKAYFPQSHLKSFLNTHTSKYSRDACPQQGKCFLFFWHAKSWMR